MQGGGWNERDVVEFLETMGMVEDNLGRVGYNLEEAWDNLVEEYYFSGQWPRTSGTGSAQLAILITITHAINTILIFDIVSKVIVGAIILLIIWPYWLLDLPLPCKQHQ